MWRLAPWFSGGLGSVRFMVGLDDLKGLSGSVILRRRFGTPAFGSCCHARFHVGLYEGFQVIVGCSLATLQESTSL